MSAYPGISLITEDWPRLTQKRVGRLPLWTSTDPDKVTWWSTAQFIKYSHQFVGIRERDLHTLHLRTHLNDHNQEEGHVSCEVDLVDLEHGGAQTENQRPDDDLDRLAEGTELHCFKHILSNMIHTANQLLASLRGCMLLYSHSSPTGSLDTPGSWAIGGGPHTVMTYHYQSASLWMETAVKQTFWANKSLTTAFRH